MAHQTNVLDETVGDLRPTGITGAVMLQRWVCLLVVLGMYHSRALDTTVGNLLRSPNLHDFISFLERNEALYAPPRGDIKAPGPAMPLHSKPLRCDSARLPSHRLDDSSSISRMAERPQPQGVFWLFLSQHNRPKTITANHFNRATITTTTIRTTISCKSRNSRISARVLTGAAVIVANDDQVPAPPLSRGKGESLFWNGHLAARCSQPRRDSSQRSVWHPTEISTKNHATDDTWKVGLA